MLVSVGTTDNTNTMEMYNGTQWVTVGGTDMKVYAVSPTTVTQVDNSGTTVTITGEGFENGATVHFVSITAGTSTAAKSTNSLTVTTPTLAVIGEFYKSSISVTNPDGISVTIESILDI